MYLASMNNVIVIGSDHHNTLGVVESLGMAGVNPFVIIVSQNIVPNSFVLKSKYCKNSGISTTYDKLIDLLHERFDKSGTEKQIVIATNDQAASLIDNHYDELSTFLTLPGTGKQGELEYWMNKLNMIHLAEKVGMNVPKTVTVKKGETLSDFVFPCITKSISTLKGAKTNIHICSDIKELNTVLSRQSKYSEIQVQQFIDKDFEFQFIGCSIDAGKKIIIPGRTHIVRPKGYDNTFHQEYVDLDSSFDTVLSQAKSFISQTHYSGLFSIEFIRDKKGVDYFLEMNFRNDGNAICVTASGTNLPYLWYLSHHDKSQLETEFARSTFRPVVLTPFIHYLFNMIQGEVTFGEWLKNNFRTTQFAAYFKQDTAPFWFHLRTEIKGITKALGYKLLHFLHIK